MEFSLTGKTIIVTGATNGIGLVTATELSRLGGQVIIISRNAAKCASVAARISTETGNPVEWITADLSTLDGIRNAAIKFKERHTHLNILVNNAGAFFFKRQITPDKLERTFALNHLSYFLLTNLLLENLKASAPARIVNVSSFAHRSVRRLDFNNLQGEKFYFCWTAYSHSKLCNLLFSYELARRLAGTGVTVNAADPGYVQTGFALNNGWLFHEGGRFFASLFAKKPADGASTSIYLAARPEVKDVTGKYFNKCKEVWSSGLSHDEPLAKKLWQVSLEMTGLPD
jgi:NAD(P)-dependent dehydrogenase (short-subunit alcohol dehydrogenase family)